MNDTAGAYCKIDIFLFTSDFEGFGLSLVEAMSSGCIPITCNIGGIRQMQIENFGYKYEEYNAEAIADKIIAYEEDRNKMANESVLARAFAVNNFSLSKQINEVLDLYKYLSNLS